MPAIQRPGINTSPAARSASASSYTIQGGDTLSRIASQNGTTVAALVEANKARYPSLESNPGAIQVGWRLDIPGPGGTGSTGSTQTPSTAAIPENNDILHVGMNENAYYEVDHLKARGNNVIAVENSKIGQDKVKVNGVTYDLTEAAGREGFVSTLGLSAEQSEKLVKILEGDGHGGWWGGGNADARDELAGIIQVWAAAEKGGRVPSRLIMSGHSVGDGIWGDDNGYLKLEVMAKVADAMPEAARQVKDLHMAACYSGGRDMVGQLQAMFPNVHTIWFYEDSAPGAASGATVHQQVWDNATRGTRDEMEQAFRAVQRYRKGANVAVWSRSQGYFGDEVVSLSDVRSNFERRGRDYPGYLDGSKALPQETGSGPLREYYNAIQAYLQHPEVPADLVPDLEDKRDQAIRLVYYRKNVAPKFQAQHKDTLKAGFEAVGLTAPDFGTLERGDALKQISTFEQAVASSGTSSSDAQQALLLLTKGLRDLDNRFIPERWV